MKEETDPDFLGLRKRNWNTSVFVPKNPLLEETFERKMIKVLYYYLFLFVCE